MHRNAIPQQVPDAASVQTIPLCRFSANISDSNLEPRTSLSLSDVGCRFLLGNDALQIQFANTLKQRRPTAIDVLGIFQRSAGPCQQPPKLLLAVQQSLSSQILPVTRQQIECEKARRIATVK